MSVERKEENMELELRDKVSALLAIESFRNGKHCDDCSCGKEVRVVRGAQKNMEG
jgi:hypothetical protein